MMIYHDLQKEISCLTFEKCGEKSKYYKDIITFDIETTSYTEKIAFMYIWMMCINGTVFYGDSWEQFIEFIDYLKQYNIYFVVWIHNLSFEFAFMQDLFEWDKVFATNFHKPIFCITQNVFFRCSYQMSGLSLAKVAENYKLPVQKLKGDLDYSLTRLPKITPLTDQERAYCENDVLILYHYIDFWLEECGGSFSPQNMPYTATGYTRKHLRDRASEEKQYKALRDIVKEASPTDPILYHLMQRCFAGGYTHASYLFCKYIFEPVFDEKTGKTRGRVKSRDKSSFYPALMVKEKYPRRFLKIKRDKFFQLRRMGYALIADVCFKNIRAKGVLTTISEHKCALLRASESTPVSVDNGRVYSAGVLVTSITELDLDTIEQVYDFDSMSIGICYASKKRYLPKIFVETVLDLYKAKTVLKGVEGKEQEYQRLKALLNSLFGMCVTDLLQALIIYEGSGNWSKQDPSPSALKDYKDNQRSLLLYQTGIYITAYARHELLSHNIALGDERVIYNDTDSTKYLYDDFTENYWEEVNKQTTEQLLEACKYHKIDPARLSPKDKKGREHPLGLMEDEGVYDYFKTLGAKRYIYVQDGDLHCTVAGCPKKACRDYLLSGLPNGAQGAPSWFEVFYKFNNQMYIPSKLSGKNTHYYTIPTGEHTIKDYLGNVGAIYSGFGVSLKPQPFELNLSSQYRAFLSNRITIDGVSHCERLEDLKEFTKIKTLWEDLKNGYR